MRILFLLSCLEPAGSETYCLSLEKAWGNRHQVFWISDQLHHGQANHPMPIHMKAFPMGIVNTWRVAKFIREHKIQVIHSHSRRSHWVAAQAAQMTKIPHITTIHQPLPVHFFSKLFPCLGDRTIAIDEVIVHHIRRHFSAPADRIELIRNGMDLNHLLPSQRQAPRIREILLIGRLSGGRWKVFETLLETLERYASRLPPAKYKVVGSIPLTRKNEVYRRLSIIGPRIAPSTIETTGYMKNLELLIRNSDGAIASGRSALECMALSRPAVLVGEGGVLGLCKPDIWSTALRTNLGDHLEPKDFDTTKLERGLRELLAIRPEQQEIARQSRAFVEQYYDVREVAKRVEAVYLKAGAR